MEDLAGRRKTLERERLRLEKLLSQHPQWRMMRAAGELPERVDGVWQFPGLNRVQASALRESLIFRAYQDVLDGLAKLGERREGNREQADAGAALRALQALEAGPEAATSESADQGRAQEKHDLTGADNERISQPGPAFRTRVKIKPTVRPTLSDGAEAPAEIIAEFPAVTVPPDDLTRIRSINRALAEKLADAGICTFTQIAAWNGEEVRRVAREMELDKRIWREGWIEQAAALILKAGGTLPEIARSVPATDVTSRGAAVQLDDRSADAMAQAPVAEASVQIEKPIVTDQPAAAAAVAGVVPVTLAMPIARLAGRLEGQPADADGRSGEAAAVLEEPKPAVETGLLELREVGALTPATADALAETKDALPPTQPNEPAKAKQPVGLGLTHKVGRRPQRLPAPSVRRLSYIRGLSDTTAERLRASGVRSFNEIAEWRAADVEWFQAILGDEARISADQWIEQASLLAQGRWTTYALKLVQGTLPDVVERPAPIVARREPKTPFAARIADVPLAAYGETGNASVASVDDGALQADAGVARPTTAEAPVASAAATHSELSDVPSEEVVSEVAREARPRERDRPSNTAAPEAVAFRPEAAVPAPVVVPFIAAKRSEPPVPVDAPPIPEATPEALSEPVRDTMPADEGDEAQDEPAAEELTSTEVRDRSPAARPPASLFADDLVEQLTLKPDGESRGAQADEPAIQSRDSGSALPEVAVSVPAVEAVRDEATIRSDVEDNGRQEAVALANVAFGADDAGEFAAPDGDWIDDREVATVRPDDDVADAEALVIRRSPARDVEPAGAAPTFEAMQSTEFDARGAEEASSWDEAVADQSQARDHEDEQGFAPLGEEASVRIVSRRADPTQNEHDAPSHEAAGHGERPAELTDDGDRYVPESGARQRMGFSPEFLARRMLQRDDETEDDYAGYRDEVEEASVTIIRAKGQATPESSIVPEQIANDESDAGTEATQDEGRGGTLKRRGLGLRFLKALTGD
jgi:predicted flap endonuclease-1-like 5' DNA nuclease